MENETEYYTQAEITHRRVDRTLSNLDRLSGRVAVGFLIWGVIYIALWVGTFVYFF
jgi:hypothetical protein